MNAIKTPSTKVQSAKSLWTPTPGPDPRYRDWRADADDAVVLRLTFEPSSHNPARDLGRGWYLAVEGLAGAPVEHLFAGSRLCEARRVYYFWPQLVTRCVARKLTSEGTPRHQLRIRRIAPPGAAPKSPTW